LWQRKVGGAESKKRSPEENAGNIFKCYVILEKRGEREKHVLSKNCFGKGVADWLQRGEGKVTSQVTRRERGKEHAHTPTSGIYAANSTRRN